MFNEIIQRYKNITKDKDWIVKIIIGGLFLYIPILGWAISFGFILDLLEDVKEKREIELPKWQNFEKLFMEGLPLGIIFFLIIILNMVVNAVIPCFGWLIGLFISIIAPLIVVIFAYRYKELRSWSEALMPSAIIESTKKIFKESFPLLLVFAVANFISIITCCFLVIPIFYSMTVFYPMLGEIYLKSIQTPASADDITNYQDQNKPSDSTSNTSSSEENKK
ncbi:MAG: hypothetical protein ACD_79C01181G0001 [uncultured bacterium]|nr:MAG: hypothetical protein ACD_79C01181G0001 [uncultured bacterium]